MIGGISLVITEGPAAVTKQHFNQTSLLSITPTELRFKAQDLDLGTSNPEIHYIIFLNNMRFEG